MDSLVFHSYSPYQTGFHAFPLFQLFFRKFCPGLFLAGPYLFQAGPGMGLNAGNG